eukprot:scaffold15470_cov26-Prasinocladus_malaysianus.AAC.1
MLDNFLIAPTVVWRACDSQHDRGAQPSSPAGSRHGFRRRACVRQSPQGIMTAKQNDTMQRTACPVTDYIDGKQH